MKTVAVISFTENGSRLAERVGKYLCQWGSTVTLTKKYKGAADSIKETLVDWTEKEFKRQDAIIFIGAAGIAVRAIAPFVKAKAEDPAVLVIDEKGTYCIPILSGHIGGANELAEFISEKIGTLAVITTATDLEGKWAVDVFAAKNRLKIQDMKKAKEISARILSGERISVYIDSSCSQIQGKLPKEVYMYGEGSCVKEPDIVIGIYKNPLWKEALYLIPQAVTLGIGCKRGMEQSKLEKKIFQVVGSAGIFFDSVCKVSSIELKKEEKGIVGFCEKYQLEFDTFDSESLRKADGRFSGSDFVKEITGVDNVCERSAVCGSGGGAIIIGKQVGDGITVAAAVQKWSVRFEQDK